MKKILFAGFAALFFSFTLFAQMPTTILVSIVKAEDERRYDKTLADLLNSADEKIRVRAALAAGRIGDDKAIPSLVNLLEKDSAAVRATAAFALGEIESAKASNAILKNLGDEKTAPDVRARLTEAAGKIAAANPKDAKTVELGEAILDVLDAESKKSKPDRSTVLLGLTAILRARPEEGEVVAAKFLTNMDARVRGDAANTLSRIRAKNANEPLRAMLLAADDANARANAARALGAAEDQNAFDLLLEAAVSDEDARVRVSAIRSLGNLKDKRAVAKLYERGGELLKNYASGKTTDVYSNQKSELLELAAAFGKITPNSGDALVLSFLQIFRDLNKISSPEIEIAYARIAPAAYLKNYRGKNQTASWQTVSSIAQGLGEFANSTDEILKTQGRTELANYFVEFLETTKPAQAAEMNKAAPDLIRAIAAFKADGLPDLLREMIGTQDVFVRAAAAEALGELPSSRENVEALQKAFNDAFVADKNFNDAQLAILDALFKLDKNKAEPTFYAALNSKDYLVRKKAFDFLSDKDLQKSDLIKTTLEKYTASRKNLIAPFTSGSKLGQILNTNADYTRAVARKNAKAILTTDKGTFTIEFFPEAAPLTVDNFIKLAGANYFNGLAIHRVVPNFVMQDGDPRGDGNGGPGWQIRCEMNTESYERGAVGMALSGKDTGGSQWFVTHAPQPHLDGGYTIFGRVNESDMKVVDNLVRGDVIRSVKIVEGNAPPQTPKRKISGE